MSSNHVEDQLTEYIDGNLSGPAYNSVKSHLVFCTNCRHLHQDILTNISKLKSLPQISPSIDLEKRIFKALSEKSVPDAPLPDPVRPSWTQWFLSFRGMSLAGAAILLIFIVQNAPKMMKESSVPTLPQTVKTEAKKKEISATPPLEAPLRTESKESFALDRTAPASDIAKNTVPPTRPQADIANLAGSAESGVAHLKSLVAPSPKEAPIAQKQDINDNQTISGYSSGIIQPLEKVISDQKTWEEYWNRHQKGASEKGSLPVIDFEKNQIIAVFAGNQPTAGFRVDITRVLLTQWENAPARVVRYRVSGPPEGVMAATVITQPFCIKIVPKTDGPTFFRKIR